MSIFQIEEQVILISSDDIIHRIDYKSPIKPKKYKYSSIIATYTFKNESVHCGVSDCLKPHHQGFLVLTSDEKETNLCEDCGQRLFNVTFDEQIKIFQQNDRIKKQKAKLNKILEHDIIKERINKLKQGPKGANWLYHVFTSFCNTYPLELLNALKELALSKENGSSPIFLINNQADASQLENMESLKGLSLFSSDIRVELITKVLQPLMELQKIADDPDSSASLTGYCQWADGLDEQFGHIETLLKEGQIFFDKWNLEKLKSIPLSKESTRLVRTSSWTVNKAIKK
ncbi:MAG: hypothetical protein OQL19_22355 [Gammaproteobacteria bacterium]|nr:hypothetical protein [Gammaproteobacteria bacterium]